MGTLLAAGHTLDQVLDLSLDQIGLAVECVTLARMRWLDELLCPLLEGLGPEGARYQPATVEGAQPARRRRASTRTNSTGGEDVVPYAVPGEQGEAGLRMTLAFMGFPVRQVGSPASGESGGEVSSP